MCNRVTTEPTWDDRPLSSLTEAELRQALAECAPGVEPPEAEARKSEMRAAIQEALAARKGA